MKMQLYQPLSKQMFPKALQACILVLPSGEWRRLTRGRTSPAITHGSLALSAIKHHANYIFVNHSMLLEYRHV